MPLYCAGLCEAVNIAAGDVERAGGEVHEVGRRQPEVDDVDALLHHPAGERVDQLRAGRTHVAADEHTVRPSLATNWAKPTPSACATLASSWSGTVPLMSYALTI